MLDKYIKLIMEGCLKLTNSDTLFISYDSYVNEEFKKNLDAYLEQHKIKNVYFFDRDSQKKKEFLQTKTNEEIEEYYVPLFDKWDEYASLNAKFLMLVSEIPGFMDDVSKEKIAYYQELFQNHTSLFRKKETSMEIAWCICAVPNIYWAQDIFKDDNNALEKLTNAIYKMCMVNEENPYESWCQYMNFLKSKTKKLNDLHIKKFHYENSLGTDLWITFPHNYLFKSAADEEILVNMPSYEVFTSPFYKETEGIVYSSKPLVYNGVTIEDFYLKFKEGKVVDFKATKGNEMLKHILDLDEQSAYLGEVALVPYDSPISNTNLTFKSTLFDENASCHLALGAGFPECIFTNEEKTDDLLLEKGVNVSKSHVDFMNGTKDLKITAITDDGEILIFKDGNFVL